MVIVKDEDNLLRDSSQVVDQGDQDGVGPWRLRGLEHAQRALTEVGFNILTLVQSGNEVGQETNRVVIISIQREPGNLDRLAIDFVVTL